MNGDQPPPSHDQTKRMTYEESLAWLYSLQVYGIKLGLENMAQLCADLGVDLQSGPQRKFIHVAGTNGKGSVCALLAAMLNASGKRTGLYTSPHLVSFRERIRLGENQIPVEHVASILSEIRDLTVKWDKLPTFFEVVTALALLWFQRQRAEWIVLETGLGGRLDATNVVTPVVSVITPIDLDHTQHLGATLREITGEKAGIMKAGVPVIAAAQAPEAEARLREQAAELGCAINFIQKPVEDSWEIALTGSHQRLNAAVAFATIITAGLRPSPNDIRQALSHVEWPGRFQRVREGRIILDGAHNPAAAARLAKTWREEFTEERATLILGVLADKDVPGVCRPLIELAARVICVPVQNPRTLAPEKLQEIIHGHDATTATSVAPDLRTALEKAAEFPDRILIAGSLFLVGEALVALGLADASQERSAQ